MSDDEEYFPEITAPTTNASRNIDLCKTPDVEGSYLTHLHGRIDSFTKEQLNKQTDDDASRLKALKTESLQKRAERTAEVKLTHGQVLDMVATFLNIDYKVVMDGLVDSQRQVDLLSSLLTSGGVPAIVFCLLDLPPPPIESGRHFDEEVQLLRRVIVTDGSCFALNRGQAVLVCRINFNAVLDHNNVLEELMFSPLNLDEDGLVKSLQFAMQRTGGDLAKISTRWGELMRKASGSQNRKLFLNRLDAFNEFLTATQKDLQRALDLVIGDDVYRAVELTKTDENIFRSNPQLARELELVVKSWYRKIEQVLEAYCKIRKESSDLGPRAELDFWRSELIRLTYIADEVGTEKVQKVLHTVRSSRKSAILDWTKLVDRLNTTKNEAMDNVKYLYDLEEISQDLYTNGPPSLKQPLHSLLSSIRMMYSTSRCYNTTERVTAVLVKVTNQVVINCRDYLTDGGTKSIWRFMKREVIARIEVCLQLHKDYKASFHAMLKASHENPKEKALECSEAYVFVRLSSFCNRLEKIRDALNTYLEHCMLQTSHLEGIEKFAIQLETAFSELVKKPYDPLDDLKQDFNVDYHIFKDKISNLQEEIKEFSVLIVEQSANVSSALSNIERLGWLHLPCLDLDSFYADQWPKFHDEILFLLNYYNTNRDTERKFRFQCPVSNKIEWSRSILKTMEAIMNVLAANETVLKDVRAQPTIRLYNILCKVLLKYEFMQHSAWFSHAKEMLEYLDSPIFSKDLDNTLHANWNYHLEEVIHEAEIMLKMSLPVPDLTTVLCLNQDKHTRNLAHVRDLAKNYNELRRSVPTMYNQLLRPRLHLLDVALDPGIIEITWSSLIITEYVENIRNKLNELQSFLKELEDMKASGIDETVATISRTLFLDLDATEPKSVDALLSDNSAAQVKVIEALNTHILSSETTAVNIVARFLEGFDANVPTELKLNWFNPTMRLSDINMSFLDPTQANNQAFRRWERLQNDDLNMFHDNCMQVYACFFKKIMDALTKATIATLEVLNQHISEPDTALIAAEFHLYIPQINLKPGLDRIQADVRRLTLSIIKLLKNLEMWGQKYREIGIPLSGGFRSYYDTISENREVLRLLHDMQGAILLLNPDIKRCGNSYLRFDYLWDPELSENVEKFINANPDFLTVEDYVHTLQKHRHDIKTLPDYHVISCLHVNIEHVKEGLTAELDKWQDFFCQKLLENYVLKMKSIFDFVTARDKVLHRQIKDLDDVRAAMECLAMLRSQWTELTNEITRIEETFNLLSIHYSKTPPESVKSADILRHTFMTMASLATSVQSQLLELQEPFKEQLFERIRIFGEDEKKFHEDYETKGPLEGGLDARDASDRLIVLMMRMDELNSRMELNADGQRLFGVPVTEYPALADCKKQMILLNRLYGLYEQALHSISKYMSTTWSLLDVEAIFNDLNEYQNRYKKLPKSLMEYPAYAELALAVDSLRDACPLIELLSHKAMGERHWERLAQLTGHVFPFESEQFCLRDVMNAPILQYKEEVEDICIGAQKEKDVEAKLKAVVSEWSATVLIFAQFKNRGELLLKGAETMEIISLLEDSSMVLSSLFTNRYNAPFKKDIQLWMKKLAKTSETLETWLLVQNLWLYLEAVFVSGDIARQLPKEAKLFSTIDKSWIRLMARARDVEIAVDVAGDEATSHLLPHLLVQLEACQKSLTGYLETLRLAFPRFFFVSDPSLLEILGQASDSHSIQNHLLNVFENVFMVEFDEKNYDRIIGIFSREMEHIKLEEAVMAVGSVELWLGKLLEAAQSSLNFVIAAGAEAMNTPGFQLINFLYDYPAQVGLLIIQFLWTRDAEAALYRSRADRLSMKDTNKSFLKLLNQLIEQTTRDLKKIERVKFETLVTIHVHQRDIFDELTTRRIKSPMDFEWLKNMRFYWNQEEEETWARVTDVNFLYQNEFLGCTERLVITPLTDRCYITLAQAIGMSMGGAPAGPAGTGKTETTKDMAKALGKYCVVFNCSDQMDFRGLGRIYKGLAQSGSWGCFDEFNRIELPVLSVAAQQISIVLQARREKKTSFLFSDGDTVPLNMEFGIFITMNPGYAGRQELPENLKIMFRPIAMMVPDRQIIMRVKLAACGFKENVDLARKFFTLYRLCEEQLSKQVHYDFGLRNILSVLRTLGAQKRANPNDSEETTVMSVLRYMNVSKLVDEDEPLFTALVEDLFPGSKVKGSTQRELQKAITEACKELNMVNHPAWNLKLVQLYETSLVRHGLMVLGPTGSGKTTCTRTLMRAMTINGRPHKEMRMNPKAITAPQMFGRLDVATNDWTDGIFSTLWRRTLKVPKTDNTWLVLDGPVDAVWIENLNSVLDDNKTLTLANGDRITMAPNCKLLFEPDNVTNASPATVSRMGMVFLSASVMPWSPILKGWFMLRTEQEQDVLEPLFEALYGDVQAFLTVKLKPVMHAADAVYIRQCCDILGGLIANVPESAVQNTKFGEHLFLFSLMWSLGSLLELPEREKLESFVVNHPSKLDWPKTEEGDSIFEYFVDGCGNWQHWSYLVEEYLYPDDHVPDYLQILVPNVDNVRTGFLIQTCAGLNRPVLLVGEQGTAKTVMMKSYLSRLDPEANVSKIYNFSSATTPNMLQRILESYVEKRVGSMFGPPGGRRLTVFIDDLSMPVVNEWGDQITNELVRQLMEMDGFYSLDKPGEFSTIVDVSVVAAMIHPGGGRNDIPHRLKRQFCIFNCTLPSDRSIDKIFSVLAEGYFSESRFCPEVSSFASRLVTLTREIWQTAKNTMLPTPAKFHYIFNLRDLSRIWQGIFTVTADGCPSRREMLELWRHECQRVISDRFVTLNEQEWFMKTVTKVASTSLGKDAEVLDADNRFFADFLRDAPEPTGDEPDDFSLDPPKIYELIPSWDVLQKKLREYQDGYNEVARGSKLDLVFFQDAMRHLVIISRAIRMPRGSIVLVGVGGSGKQSLTRLASFIAGYSSFQIAITRAYNVASFLEDLKSLYRTAGQKGQGVTFVFTENEIKEETFLEYLNNILSAGEVANLFAKDEMEEIANLLIPDMKKEFPRRAPTMDALYDYFLSRAQKNLHVVLCFSPVGPKFRARTLKFPGLISGCTINWFQKWPKDALVAVSNHILAEFSIVCTPTVKKEIIVVMADTHEVANDACIEYFDRFRRLTHVTPKSFLSLLSTYKTMYKTRLANIDTLNKRMSVGVTKLVEAAQGVDVLKQELEVKEKDIAVASAAANEVLTEVKIKAEATEKVKSELLVVKEKAEELVTAIAQETMVAENKLMAAKPALMAAEAALLTIKAADIATVRKLGKPPYLITVIMDVVLILFQKKVNPVVYDEEKNFFAMSWSESLKLMADTRFLQRLQNFPKDKINAETIDLMQPYLSLPDYTYEKAKASSGSVAGLIQWTRAMADFYQVNKEVLPLKANLAIQQKKLSGAQTQLNEAQAFLDEKQRELDEVQRVFDVALEKQQAVLIVAMACKNKMDTANALINGLTGERQRWMEQLQHFNVETERLVGDALLLTAFLSYAGPFNQEFRVMLQSQWLQLLNDAKIPTTFTLNIINLLADAATIGEWNVCGLPSDELSVQNGILVRKAPRYPLLIDPQTQGKNWIKNMEKDNELQVTTLNHKYFRTHVEDCVSLGKPLLIEDVEEELDPVLDNVLEKNYIKLGTTLKVKLGDKDLDIHPEFRLYITTKLPNPAFSPEIAARTAVVDFTVTMKGLEEQLLGRVIVSEQSELEIERVNLVRGVAANRREMEDLEAGLLQKLSTVEGSLLEDEDLVRMLNVSKDTAADLRVKLDVAEKSEEKLKIAREEFRPVATRGSILYFLVTDMALVNCMYQTSLAQFLERFDVSLERSEKHMVPAKRIGLINDYLTYEIFQYQTRGLYEVDKFTFVLLLALKIDLQRGSITPDEFQCLIKGGAALDLLAVAAKPSSWISDTTWLNLVQLSNIRPFHSLLEHVGRSDKQWRVWFEKEAPEDEPIMDPYHQLDVFKKFLLVRAWCPDRTFAIGRQYLRTTLGAKFAESVILRMDAMLDESQPTTPLLCLLSAGSDPTPQIERLARKNATTCSAVSMGQGQEVHARALVAKCMAEGGWVLLQNCHLGLAYMSELSLHLTEAESCHEEFRIFLTTEVHPMFPISLLQISIKFTNEPPQGVKAGLKRTYSDMSQDILELNDSWRYLPLLFTISFFHTIVQERRKFGPLGWNIPYEFNSADWYASSTFIRVHLDSLDKKANVSWATVRYMIGEIQYGGRVTDDYDQRMLNAMTKLRFSEQVLADDYEMHPQYPLLKNKTIVEYLDGLEKLPGIDPPQVCGLHSNANIAFQTDRTRSMMATIVSIQPREGSSLGGSTREQRVANIVTEMMKKLPTMLNPHETKERLKEMGILSPMVIFLRQEIDRMRIVLNIVKKTFEELLLAIEGTIIMNEALSDALDRIDDARIPEAWLRRSWSSSSLGFWFSELIERNLQFSSWLAKGRPPHFWMTGFFNPQGFLTAMRQEVARAHKGWALDSVVLHNSVLKSTKEEVFKPPNEGVYVYGLYVEGAGWDKRYSKLVESAPKVLTVLMPLVHIFAINTTLQKKDPKADLYQCPVYKKPMRTDLTFITPLWLSTDKPAEHWILRGVALLCDTK